MISISRKKPELVWQWNSHYHFTIEPMKINCIVDDGWQERLDGIY